METRAGIVKGNDSADLEQSLLPPPGIHISISLCCLADTGTPTRWEKYTTHKQEDRRPVGT